MIYHWVNPGHYEGILGRYNAVINQSAEQANNDQQQAGCNQQNDTQQGTLTLNR